MMDFICPKCGSGFFGTEADGTLVCHGESSAGPRTCDWRGGVVKCYCPDCHKRWDAFVANVINESLTVCCSECHAKRVAANNAPRPGVGGTSCTPEMESQMRSVSGPSRSPCGGGTRIIRKSEPMGG